MIAFPFLANLEQPIAEEIAYLSDVLEAEDSTEQRVQLRAVPRQSIEYSLLTFSAAESQLANTLLYGIREQGFGVPLWMYADRTTAAATAGATTFGVNTTDVPWMDSVDSVLLLRDPYAYDLLRLDSASTGFVTTQDPAGLAWPKGTTIVPVRLGRLGADAPFSWESRDLGSGRLKFAIDATGLTPPAGTPVGSMFAGVEVLDVVKPNRSGTVDENAQRKLVILDEQTGPVRGVGLAAAPMPLRAFRWTALSRAEARLMTDWIDARKGRLVPFWLPSWQNDMTLATDHASGATTATVRWSGYFEYLWSKGYGRRAVAIYTPGAPLEYKQIIAAAHSIGAPNETITFDAPTVRDYAAADTMIMFLKYCRHDEDVVRRTWLSPNCVEAEIPVREIPVEEPVAA